MMNKKITILLILLFVYARSKAQDEVVNGKLTIANMLVIDNENNMPLEGAISESDWGNYVLANNSVTRTLRLGVSNDGHTRGEIEIENNNSPSSNILFKTSNSSGGASVRMKIADNGNIGIGTVTPNSKFSVLGQDSEFYSGTVENKMMIGRNGSEKFQFRTTDNHGYLDYIQDSDSNGPHVLYIRNLAQGSHSNNDIQLRTLSGRFTVKKDGNVGIGITSPSSKLHIFNSGSQNGLIVENSSSSMTNYGLTVNNTATTNGYLLRLRSSAIDRVIVTGNGNLGIGTTTPDSKLTVKGNIHTEEIKVDLSVPGPDYVFQKDYDLPTLEEVENHIREKGHLINIPSAKEMEANGIELGEMNIKLLEKIEELTLYILQQQKELIAKDISIQDLGERMIKQEAEIKRFKILEKEISMVKKVISDHK